LWRRRRRCIAGVLDLIDVMSQVMFCRAVGSGDVLRAGRDVSSRGLGLTRDGLHAMRLSIHACSVLKEKWNLAS
jgi:hypothetical protein